MKRGDKTMAKRFDIREHPEMKRDIERQAEIKKELAALDRPLRRNERTIDKLLTERRLKKELAEVDARLREKKDDLIRSIRPSLFCRRGW